jgi:hypothetical protein
MPSIAMPPIVMPSHHPAHPRDHQQRPRYHDDSRRIV